MAFTLDTGTGVITQTGVDANPSGLANIAGVTVIDRGNTTTSYTIYDLGTLRLDIAGDLTHDPDRYQIVANIQNGFRVIGGADYKYGIERTINGRTTYSKGLGIVSTYQGNFFNQFGVVLGGGEMTWNGGIMRTVGAVSHSNCQVTSNSVDSVWQCLNISGQWRATGQPNFKAITMQGINADCALFLLSGWQNLAINFERAYYQTPASGGPTRVIEDPVFANNQTVNDVITNQSTGVQQLTFVKNSDVIPRLGKLSNNSYADFPVVQTVKLDISDTDNNLVGVDEVVTYIEDSDNGSRLDSTVTDYVSDRKYIATTDANGEADLGDVLYLAAVNIDLTTGALNQDFRGNFGNGNADFNIYIGGYNYLPAITRQSLLGNGGTNVLWTMFDDINPTLDRVSALAKLASSFTIDPVTKTITVTANSTLDDLYDITKAYKYNGTEDNFQVPTAGALLANGAGETITVAEDYDLIVNSSVSLLRGAKFRQLKLTGTGELTNDGTINFPFEDALGVRVSINNLDPEGFGVTWNIRYKEVGETAYTELSGTGNSTQIIVDNAVYDLQARVKGYTWRDIQFDPAESLSVDMGLQFHIADDGTPQYLKSFNQALVDIFEYDDIVDEVKVTNTTGAILEPGFPEIYQVIEKVQQDPDLVWLWVNPVTTNATSQRVLVPPTSPIRLFLSNDSDASVRITCPVVDSETGVSVDDRVKGNPDGFSIILGSAATADSSLIVSQLINRLGGDGFESTEHALVKIKTKVDKGLTKTQYLGLS
jgi:hypothetical protein